MNRKQIERASYLFAAIDAAQKVLGKKDHGGDFYLGNINLYRGNFDDCIQIKKDDFEYLMIAYINKLNAELKEFGYEDD